MYEYRCVIREIIDGDTADIDIDLGFGVWLYDQRVRFMGIDTPESRTSDKTEKVFGLFAKEYVKRHIPEGSVQTLKTFKDGKGKFGRILGDFIIEDTTLITKMIDEGIGAAYHGQSKDDILEQHLINRERLISEGLISL
jgi:micrococcal nuclease